MKGPNVPPTMMAIWELPPAKHLAAAKAVIRHLGVLPCRLSLQGALAAPSAIVAPAACGVNSRAAGLRWANPGGRRLGGGATAVGATLPAENMACVGRSVLGAAADHGSAGGSRPAGYRPLAAKR